MYFMVVYLSHMSENIQCSFHQPPMQDFGYFGQWMLQEYVYELVCNICTLFRWVDNFGSIKHWLLDISYINHKTYPD